MWIRRFVLRSPSSALHLITLGILLAPPGLLAQSDQKSQVAAAVSGIYAAITEADADELGRYVLPEGYSEFSVSGQLARLDMEYLRPALASGVDRQFHVEDMEIDTYPDAAVVTGYRVHRITRLDGTVSAGRQRLSMMWVKIDSNWKLAHVHLSPAGG